MTVTDMPAPHTTVTQRLVGLSSARGDHPALVGGMAAWPGETLSHADLAVTLQTAAAGLAWGRHWVWHRRDMGELATLVQQKYRRLGDRLLGIVELAGEREHLSNFSPPSITPR